jgi:hypothetical protein
MQHLLLNKFLKPANYSEENIIFYYPLKQVSVGHYKCYEHSLMPIT